MARSADTRDTANVFTLMEEAEERLERMSIDSTNCRGKSKQTAPSPAQISKEIDAIKYLISCIEGLMHDRVLDAAMERQCHANFARGVSNALTDEWLDLDEFGWTLRVLKEQMAWQDKLIYHLQQDVLKCDEVDGPYEEIKTFVEAYLEHFELEKVELTEEDQAKLKIFKEWFQSWWDNRRYKKINDLCMLAGDEWPEE